MTDKEVVDKEYFSHATLSKKSSISNYLYASDNDKTSRRFNQSFTDGWC